MTRTRPSPISRTSRTSRASGRRPSRRAWSATGLLLRWIAPSLPSIPTTPAQRAPISTRRPRRSGSPRVISSSAHLRIRGRPAPSS
jgi:hypothetical protein